ncbi:N-acetylmuramoyl-L-alanine amidase [Hydrogenophaga electricum]|uniref:N-acetylmuramoyl-L-alanine amidase n=1 Tax=Hydrogenophaga electricum TaxID=1230953 RepID=A0ABQ6C2U8_9BURK|nr:N-acetylmuramoyl-L-alanine amidase [Hydrogenophaga electricum]GLS14227.1 N-acetylmuramoyl-L-alanine amidase [Hydrogenophaga electricum]
MTAPPPARRHLLRAGLLILLIGRQHIAWGATVIAVRLWPAPDYTRVTIESDGALRLRSTRTDNPRQLVADIEGVDLVESLQSLASQLRTDDPNLAAVRVAPAGPGVARLTLDLKQPVRPQVFQLTPVAAYQHRLVLDLYPQHAVDPLDQLVAQYMRDTDASSERAARLLGLDLSALREPGAAGAPAAEDPLGQLIAERERQQPPATAAAAPSAAAPASTRRGKTAPPGSSSGTERLILVALDPGHGGEDPGAIGPGGTREKDVVLQIALKLRDRINSTRINGNPMRAYLTRDGDFFVPLNVRVQKAQRVRADLFISIHADAFMTARPQGASVYALSTKGASSAAARWIADKENAADLVGGLNVRSKDATVQRALLDMSTTAQIKDSLKVGTAMLGEVGRVGKLHKPQVEQAGFAVLKAPDIPSVLVETAFISNPDEETRLRSAAYQNDLADALLRGVVRYFQQNPPLARTRTL